MKTTPRFIGLAMIVTALVLTPLASRRGDYPAFYIAGHHLQTEPSKLYDLVAQREMHHRLAPETPEDEFLFYPSAPFLAVIFRPLALLPYDWSYAAWLSIGFALALLGIRWLWRAGNLQGDWLTAALASLSFTPVLLEGWVGGQTTMLVLSCLALSIYLHTRGWPLASGIVLAVLTFKPTLLLLVVPMLAMTRSFRVLFGMLIGGSALAAMSVWAVGYQGCLDFLRFLHIYAEVKRLAPEALRPWKYVDLRSAAYPVFYHPTVWGSILIAGFIAAGAILLVRTWKQATDWRIAWASALIWTPVLSPHFAIYDTVVLIPAAFLLAAAGGLTPRLLSLLAMVYLVGWFSQPVSQFVGFQPLTLAIALLGLYSCGLAEYVSRLMDHAVLLLSRLERAR